MKRLALCAAFGAALLLGACKSNPADTDPSTGQVANVNCPMMPDHEFDPEVTTEFEGMTIGFCCEKCVDKFETLSRDEKVAKLQAAGAPVR